ncbi:MAG: energy-coupling factor transporter transmembrane protein EcfT [Anaerolineae bacterium]|nr:energy-coupling factor transporter transmembrane protein EcfT [Anaerolineae bacterium]
MADNGFQLQFKERHSTLNRIYPLVKLIWVVIVAVGLFIYKSPLPGAVAFLLILFLAAVPGKIPLRQIFGSAKLIFGLGLLLMIFHFFADPGEEIFRVGFLKITDTGLMQGPVFFFRLSVVVLASFVMIWTTDPRDLMTSLAKAGMPYRMAFTVFLAMRFLPLAQREVEAVKDAHAIRGKAQHSSLGHRFKLWQRYMFTVLINGLRKAEAAAVALDCRAFGTAPTRTYVKDVHFRVADLWLPLATVVISTLLILVERGVFS